ncbi:MAG TPA: hypothetical protein VFB28_06265 [Terriglobales bacterium]|nr:hypothetical protein [Terriglobales bacterium]
MNVQDLQQLCRRWSTALCVLLILACAANAQGIHTTLRAQANPYGAYESYASVWGDGHYAYVGSERRNGVLIYDISNPDAPVLVSSYAPSNSFDMEDVKVANNIGYFASNYGSGLHIVDLSDPANPRLLSQITSANGGYDKTHKIAVWQHFVFIPQNLVAPAIIKVFDVSNPSLPVLFTSFTATDSQWVNDITIQTTPSGQVRLYAAGWNSKCDIWDITNIATQAPVLLGSFNAGVSGSSSYATADGNFLAYSRKTIDSTSEVKIYDITNPAAAVVASTITMSAFGIDAIAPHDPKIMGNLMYVSWFQAGTLIFDITNPRSPMLVGSYDTWPAKPAPSQLDGNWGVYPFLGADRVLLSDRNTGLYIVDTTGVSSAAAMYNFKVNPTSVVGPLPSTATVYLVGVAPGSGLVVNLSSNSSIAAVPPSVTIPAGATNASATVTTIGVASTSTATLTASDGTTTLSTVLTVTPEIPSTVKFVPVSVVGGNSTVGTVTMKAPAMVDTVVTLTVNSGNSAVASIPPSVTVLAGSSTANFTVLTNVVAANTTVKISAAANGTSVNNTFTVTPNIPSTVTFSPASVIGAQSSTGKVTLAATAITDTTVTLAVTSGNSAVASIPSSVVVPTGTSSATFTVVTNPVSAKTTVMVSAAANGISKTGSLTVTTNSPTGVTFNPSSITGGASTTGKVTFALPVISNTVVSLAITSGGSAIASMPSSVTVLAGSTSATWTVVSAPVSVTTTVQISATANAGTKTGTLTVKPNTPTAFSFTPSTVTGGGTSVGKVTFGLPVASDTTVTLTVTAGSSAVASIPSSFVVPAGNSSGTFTITTAPVTQQTTVTVSAAANGGSKSANLTVK